MSQASNASTHRLNGNGAPAPEHPRPDAPSTGRPRLDNDRHPIAGIHIMPTYEEITSSDAVDFSTLDPTSWDLSGASGRFDRAFRLLREHTAGQIRDACKEVLHAVPCPSIDVYGRQQTTIHFDYCDDAKIQHITMSKKHGIEFTVACTQPETTRNMTDEQRQIWWERSNRLRPGTVVCVFDKTGVILHFVVSDSTLRRPEEASDDCLMDRNKFNLSSGNTWSYVNLKLVNSSDLGDALRWYQDTERSRCFLDIPDLTLECFKNTLEALQRQSQSSHRLIDLFSSLNGSAIERPAYAQAPGFEFNLDCLMEDGQTFRFDPSSVPSTAQLPSFPDLGPYQIEALLQSLSNEVSLIHGQPGTGKSYLARVIIKVLIKNRETAGIGPVVCIFHSNSALDRTVEQLLDDGFDKIVRMGGRSKSERLQRLNLPLTHYAGMSRQERRTEKQMTKELKKLVWDVEKQLLELSDIESPLELDRFLSSSDPRSREEVFGPRDGDFSDYQPETVDALQEWLLAGDRPLIEEQSRVSGPLDATLTSARKSRHQGWLKSIRDRIIGELTRSYEEFEATRSEVQQFHDNARRQILQDAQIIAVTTKELAKHHELLHPIHAKVLVCDDASKFLESQTLTAILPSTEHMILIGDPEHPFPRLQPEKLQRTHLESVINPLNVSLFERLPSMTYGPRLPVSMLYPHRRMRPSTSLLTSLARNTEMSSEVVGTRPLLFWLDHRHTNDREGAIQVEDFSLDDFEIEMVTAMLKHLVRQDHHSTHDIAVITSSLGQIRQLLRRMETEDTFTTRLDDFDLGGLRETSLDEYQEYESYTGSVFNNQDRSNTGAASLGTVRLATLDSFRGQEAKIVIILLGRWTSSLSLHSTDTHNRIDVLMTRAQHGCYILGDSNAYKENPKWRRIINKLEAGGNLGDSLELRCPRHPGRVARMSSPDDFKLASPDGGCSQPCGGQLDCGHDCRRSCHSNMMHKVTKCNEPCPRRKPRCGHACPLTCGDSCEESCSKVMVDDDLTLPCGHIIQSPRCWQVQDPAGVACETEVDYKVPGCDHEVTVPCYTTDPNNPSFRCPAKCGAALPCGHLCQRKCHECNSRYGDTFLEAVHDLCDQPCGKRQPDCVHSCQRTCHDSECGPCQQPCDIRCSHTKCDKLCHEPCLPCIEDHCGSGCPHSTCTLPCAAPCNWEPCSRRCTIMLDCGHQCPSVCGEECPDSKYCQICGPDDILFTVVDSLHMTDYRDVNLDEDPCIFPHCGHCQTKSSMDQQLGLQDFYETSEKGAPLNVKGVLMPFSVQKVPCCTQCRGSFREISRYGRIIRRPMLDKSLKEAITWSNSKFFSLIFLLMKYMSELCVSRHQLCTPDSFGHQSLSFKLEGNMQSQIDALRDFVGDGRYAYLAYWYKDIQSFSRELVAKEEVFKKLADLTRRAKENSHVGGRFLRSGHQPQPVVHLSSDLVAMSLSLRCNIAIMADFLRLWNGAITPDASPRPSLEIDLTSNFRGSQDLIKRARQKNRSTLEAQGHIYFALFCGFARAAGVENLTQIQKRMPNLDGGSDTEMPEFPFTDQNLKSKGLRSISKASEIHARNPLLYSCLSEEIRVAQRFIHEGFLDEVAWNGWYMGATDALVGTGPWYVCDNGHPFMDRRVELMIMGQLRCTECNLIVADHGHESEEGATSGLDEDLPSQGETLVEI